MYFCFSLIILSLFVRTTLQTCSLHYVHGRYMHDLEVLSQFRRYAHCENETLSSDFYTRVPPLDDRSVMQWIEINNTNSPTIEPGAFAKINVTDVRIKNSGVRIIKNGAFERMRQVAQLSLHGNRLTEIKTYYFADLPHLRHLDLSSNLIAKISEESFADMTSLKRLFLQNNRLTELPEYVFSDLIDVETLDLSFNSLTRILNHTFDAMEKLVTVRLNNNKFAEIGGSLFAHNFILQNVDFSNNNLKKVDNLSFYNPLRKLNLSYNSIEELSFSRHTNIHSLDLSCNLILSMATFSFSELNIVELYLDHNHLGLRPLASDLFSKIPSLEKLSLSENRLRQTDLDLFRHNKRLINLNLSHNFLSTQDRLLLLPLSIRILDLSFNNLDSKLNFRSLLYLQSLDFSHNNLTDIPYNFMEDLSWLEKINFSNNQITNVQLGCFKGLNTVKKLDLSNNIISNLALGVFVGLDRLQSLDLSHNNLTQLPDGVFHNLRSLTSLNLSYNKVTNGSIADALAHLKVLTDLGLAGNNWSCEALSEIVRTYKKIKLIDVGDYNQTNIDGVSCTYKPQGGQKPLDGVPKLEETAFEEMSAQLLASNILLGIIFAVFMCNIVQPYLPNLGRLFVRRPQYQRPANPSQESNVDDDERSALQS